MTAQYGAGAAPGEVSQYGARLDSGCASIADRRAINSVLAQASGNIYLAYFRAPASFTAANLRMISTATAAGATPTVVRFGLWTVASSGDLTLVGSTANDTTVFASTNTAYSRAMTASVDLEFGAWYAAGALVVTAAAAPTVLSSLQPSAGRQALSSAPRLSMSLAGQSDLPSSVDAGSLASTDTCAYVELLA